MRATMCDRPRPGSSCAAGYWLNSRPQSRFSRFTFHVSRFPHPACRSLRTRRAFTLIEIMIVVGIMGIALTLGVPIVYKVWHRTPMVQAIRDFTMICGNARSQAILQGRPVDLVLHPRPKPG